MDDITLNFLKKSKKDFKAANIKASEGDIILIINALMDYADICDKKAEGEETFETASLHFYAERFRDIAGRYSQSIGYNREKAIARCNKRIAKEVDFGADGLSLAVSITK